MRSLGGFVLLAGIGVGLFVYFPAPVDSDTSLEQAQRAVATRVASDPPGHDVTAPARARTIRAWLALRPASGLPRHAQIACRRRNGGSRRARPIAVAAKVEPCRRLADERRRRAADIGGPQGSLDPTDPESRYKLVVDIQQQLKRVGCYWGRINGSWSNNTREAMRAFTNAHQRRAAGRQARLCAAVRCCKSHSADARAVPARDDCRWCEPRGKKCSTSPPRTPEVLPWKAGNCGTAGNAPLHAAAEQRRLDRAAARPHGHRRPEGVPAGRAGAAHPRHRARDRCARPAGCRHRRARSGRRSAGLRFRRSPLSRSRSVKPRSLGHRVVPGRERHATI